MSGPASVRAGAAQCASAHRVSRASGGARLAIGHMLLACGCGWRADGGVAGAGTRIECRGRQCMVDVRRLRDRSSTSIGLCCCWSTAPCPSRLLPSRMRTRSARRGPCMLTLAGKWTRAGVRAARPAHSETTCMHSAQAPGHTHTCTHAHMHTHTHTCPQEIVERVEGMNHEWRAERVQVFRIPRCKPLPCQQSRIYSDANTLSSLSRARALPRSLTVARFL